MRTVLFVGLTLAAAIVLPMGCGDDASGGAGGTGGDPAAGGSGPPCTADRDRIGLTTRTANGREYLSYAPPSYERGTPMPVLVALHGAGDTNTDYLAQLWEHNADEMGFLVLAPEGSQRLNAGYTWKGEDRETILAAIDDLRACYDTHPKKTILHGFSAGGIMAFWIGLSEARRFSGIAINAADLGSAEAATQTTLLPAAWKIPVSHFHGDRDPQFPLEFAQAGIDRLKAAGHPTFFHVFQGGHTADSDMAGLEYEELIGFSAP